jgi:hypothetical protein
MGSMATPTNGISFLTQSGTGLLANLPVQLSAATLQAAPKQDVVELSAAALQLQEVDGIFGLSPPSQTAATPLTFTPPQTASGGTTAAATASSPSLSLPSGVSAADFANATPGQQANIANETQQQQLVQALFYPPTSSVGTVNATG